MNTATIFDIQRNSFVDGPGIRTTVFFKGCNLRCRWCHNPESQLAVPERMFYRSKCAHCEKCVSVCPAGAIGEGLAYDREKCRFCGRCALFCPNDALRICGTQWTLDALCKELRKDLSFYQQSGGGVTLSGGECLLQAKFVTALCSRCAAEGISAAIDTAGNVPWSVFEPLLPKVDWFLYDVKCRTEELHRQGTGVSNALLLQNLQRLLLLCPQKVWVRTPVIPGFNADPAEIGRIADFLHAAGKPAKWELLPYHRLGEGKCTALGRPEFHAEVPSEALMASLRAIAME